MNILMPEKLTAENGAKALMIGEFFETFKVCTTDGQDECGCGDCEICVETVRVPVSWSTIKKIYQKLVENRETLLREVDKEPNGWYAIPCNP